MPLEITNDEGDNLTFDTPPQGELACVVCGTSLTYGGRGAKPKYCEIHRKQPSKQTSSGKSVDTFVNQIEMLYLQTAGILSIAPGKFQDDAIVVGGSASQMAESWRPLLEKDPKVRAMWNKLLTGTGWSGVIIAHATVAYAIAQNHNMIPTPKGQANV